MSKLDRDYLEALYSTKKPKAFTFNLAFKGSQSVNEEIYIDSTFKIKDKVFYQNINNPAFLYISSNDITNFLLML